MQSHRILGHPNPRRYRTIWISDVHLGTRACQADLLLDFLRHHDADTIYLVGDIVDGQELAKSWYWPQSHNDIVQKILRKVRKGTSVIYIPGNHDDGFRHFIDLQFGGVVVRDEAIHRTADGRSLWVVHGDAFDGAVKFSRLLAAVGSWAYDVAISLNVLINRIGERFGASPWSLASAIKRRSRRVLAYIEAFEHAVVAETRRRNLDGVVCGHIHTVALKSVDGVLYCNDGDWVENCTALVEHDDGHIAQVRWQKAPQPAAAPAHLGAPAPVSAREALPTGALS
ncbi:MAG TPA: UDP-2,3-diacylglucosamine diphosphatase [Alphaproteobacteria bacterium]